MALSRSASGRLVGFGLTALGVVAVYLVAFVVPDWVVDAPSIGDADRIDLENKVRATLLSGLAGVLFLVTAFFTWRQVKVAQDRLDLERKGNFTDRFAKSVEQLGSTKAQVRIGGIYSLEQVAKEDPDEYHAPTIEVLSAFLRASSEPNPRAVDRQAALTVLGRRGPR
ncbi:MAG: hypothetical protein AAGC53_03675 [Actinomycetota bacterium]